MLSLYQRTTAEVRVGSELSEEFWVQVGVQGKSVLSLLVFAIAVNAITNCATKGLMRKICM